MSLDDVSQSRAKVSTGFTNVSSLAVSAFVLDYLRRYGSNRGNWETSNL